MFKTQCVESCPLLYFTQEEERNCLFVGEIQLPVPFTIAALVITVGVGISAFLKGADKYGREQPGTAFFITMLAIVDVMLRIIWVILAYSSY